MSIKPGQPNELPSSEHVS